MTQVNSAAALPPVSLGDLVEQLVNFGGGPDEFLVRLLMVQCRAGAAAGGAVLVAGKEQMELLALAPAVAKGQPVPEWVRAAQEAARQVLASGRTAVAPVGGDEDIYGHSFRNVVAIPLRAGESVRGVAAFFVRGDAEVLAQARERLELTASLFSLYDMRMRLQGREVDLQKLAAALEVLDQFNGQKRAMAAAMALCNHLAAARKATRVTLGLTHGKFVRAKVMSHTEKFTRQMKLVQDIESAMEECADQDTELVYPAPAQAGTVTRAVETLAQKYGPSAICCLPLRQGGKVVGVLALERAAETPFTLQEVELLRLTCDLATTRLVDLFDHDRWLGSLLALRTRRTLALAMGTEHTWIKATVLGVVAVVLFVTLARGPYRVEAPFVVDAVQRQSISAPFEGFLKEVNVEPGNPVSPGDKTPMAMLDTQLLEAKLREAENYREQFSKEAEKARSANDTVGMQIASAQARAHEAEAAYIRYQIEQCRIVAPFAGKVISGDLKRQVGKPVQTGEVLFEVADLQHLRADLMVPENDIVDIKPGDKGQLASAADPGNYVNFKVDSVNPMAEVLVKRNVFRVRVTLENPPEWFRPEMIGLAKITLPSRSYLWLWTHEMVGWVRMKLWL